MYKLAYIVKCGSAHSRVRHTTVSKDPTGVWKTVQQRYQFMYSTSVNSKVQACTYISICNSIV